MKFIEFLLNTTKFKLKSFLLKHNELYKVINFLYYIRWNSRKLFGYKILDRSSLLSKKDQFSYVEYGAHGLVKFSNPISLKGTNLNQIKFYSGKRYYLPPSFYNVFYDADLIGPEAIGVSSNNEVILETGNGNIDLLDKCSPHLFNNKNNIPIQNEFNCVVSLVNAYNNEHQKNYFHWISESLFLLESVEHYSKLFGIQPHLLINKNPTSVQKESLEILGYGENDISEWDYLRAKAKILLVPAMRKKTDEVHGIIYPSAIEWLKIKVSNHLNNVDRKNYSKNIFISRQKSYGRRFVNYDEIINCLKKYGLNHIVWKK